MKNFYNINFDLTKNEIVKLDWDPYNHQLLIIMDQISKQILKTVQTEQEVEKSNSDFIGFEGLNNKKFFDKKSWILVDLDEMENWYNIKIDIDSEYIKGLWKSIINAETFEKREFIRKKILELFNLTKEDRTLELNFQ